MNRTSALILVAVMLLTPAACGETPGKNASQNNSGVPSSTPQIETFKKSTPSAETGPNESGEAESSAISNTNIAPQPAPAPQQSSVPESAPVLQPSSQPSATDGGENSAMPDISITVGGSVFSAKLYDNSAARALLAQFPMTLNMSDLNSNEKYYYLADDLPSVSTEKPAAINAGDLMCWSGNCLVLFYKSFSNSYGGYVRLGYVPDASGLAAALGSGNAQVSFAVSE